MVNRWTIISAVALAALTAACSGPPPAATTGQNGGTSAPTSGTTAIAYNPANDLLVNPKVIFEPFPKGLPAEVDTSATLVYHMAGNPTSLNPLFSSSVQDDQVGSVLYNGLFSFDKQMNWEINKDAVDSFSEAPDHLSSTVQIKPGLKWQDGQPWGAEDVAFSYKEIMDPRVPAIAVRGSGVDQLKGVVAVGPLTVRFDYKEPLATNKWNIGFPIIPKHLYDNAAELAKDPSLQQSDYFNHYNREGVVGSGPYKLVSWASNDEIVLDRWDGYVGEAPIFKRIIFRIQPDPNTMLLLFKKGSLDVIDSLTAKQFATQTNDADFSDHGYKAMGTEWTYSYIGWNLHDTKDYPCPFFTDVRVRRAMTYAMNVPEIIDKLTYNLSTQCHGIAHPDSWYYNPDIQLIPFDLKKAGELLDEAGWKLSPDDGWRYKTVDGQKTKFEFELLIPSGAITSEQIAAYYARNLKQIGVSLKTRVLEWATFQKIVNDHKFQASIAAWGVGTDPDMDSNLWSTDQYQGGRNYGGYSNPRVDELFKQGRREFDQAKRAKIYQEIDKLVYDDQPYLFLTNRPTLAAVNRKLRGIIFSPRGIYGFDPGMNNWWFPAAAAMGQ